jgi:hypothetical protein
MMLIITKEPGHEILNSIVSCNFACFFKLKSRNDLKISFAAPKIPIYYMTTAE